MANAGTSVLVVGDVMMDIVVRPDGPLLVGGDRRAAIRPLPGGSAANVAAWLGHAGGKVIFAGRVGRADHRFHRDALAAFGVDPKLAVDDVLQTGTLVTLLSADGERSFLTDRGANDRLCAEDLPISLLENVALMHVSGYALVAPEPRAAVLDLMAEARRRAVAVSVDPPSYSFLQEIRPDQFIKWTSGAELFFPNSAEAAVLAGCEDRAVQLDMLSRRYGTVVIKEGAGGAVAAKAGSSERWSASAPAAEVIDTTGAGDAFLAGYLRAHLSGEGISVCLKQGVAAGARAVGQLGGRPVAPGANEEGPRFP